MQYLVAVLIIVLAALLVNHVIVLRKRSAEPDTSPVRFCIPLSRPIELDTERLTTDFREQWGIRISCQENADWGNPIQQIRRYLLTDGKSAIMITVSARALPAGLRSITAEASTQLTPDEKLALMSHEGFVMLEHAAGADTSVENVRFTLKALFTVLGMSPATGYIGIPGQMYQPMERVSALTRLESLETPILFLAATGVQVTDQSGKVWMHTHGMEQFALPDIEVKYADQSLTPYYEDLLRNCACYLIEQGPVLRPGHTAELAEDGVIYEIRTPRGESKKHFGRHGALEIVRKQ